MKALTRKVLDMRHLFRQWRLLRYVKKELDKEMVGRPAIYGMKPLLPSEKVIGGYATATGESESEVLRVLYSLVDDNYLTKVHHGMPALIGIDTTKGQEFVPFFSGLVLGELKLLGPLWTFVGGAASVLAIVGLTKL